MRPRFRPVTNWERRRKRLMAWLKSDEAVVSAFWLMMVLGVIWSMGYVR